VLIISHAAFERLEESNPKDVDRVLKNLVRGTEKVSKHMPLAGPGLGGADEGAEHALW